jgi:protein tyrosine phosphatase
MFNIYDEIKKQKGREIVKINIFNLVRKLKEMRLFLVENILQYEFIYSFICFYVRKLFELK